MNRITFSKLLAIGLTGLAMAACSDDNKIEISQNENDFVNKNVGNFTAAEWQPGGELGTTTNEQGCYSNPSPAIEQQGLEETFKKGEDSFEHTFTLATFPFRGLGPAWVRSGCEYCHPSYGHGKRQNSYRANVMGNGYLLVIYHTKDGKNDDGSTYKAGNYISEVTGMPQTQAMFPFKAPVEESGIHMQWLKAVDEHGNKFPDGETYNLTYPEISIDRAAFNTNPKPKDYEVRLESTIGLYGTGLLDAIDQDSMRVQYQREARFASLNPGIWDAAANDWAQTAYYKFANGKTNTNGKPDNVKRIKRFTYGMTRATLQDGPGANAIWNITNVTRSDRHYLYTTKAWAKAMSEDPQVIAAIKAQGASPLSLLHPYYADGTDAGIQAQVYKLLGLNTPTDETRNIFEKNYLNVGPDNGREEMTDADFYAFMVWHRGLGVPRARGLQNEQVQRGKELFYQMGCIQCHRPSWTIKQDKVWYDNISMAQGKLPTYNNQVIWPYTDLVQHKLHMLNDIRTGWCRTTPLWGRGLSAQETGASERLHDCRAQTVVEAIMWHGYSKESDAYNQAQKFYKLSKADRDAVVAFINAI